MRVLFISRSSAKNHPGGDTVQAKQTLQHLNLLGVETAFCFANEHIDYRSFDLIHFFNINRPQDMVYHAQKSKLPFVLSTVFLDYAEFDQKNGKFLFQILRKFFNAHRLEYLKAIARYALNGEKIRGTYYWLKGHQKSMQWCLDHAAALLPNSHSEFQRLAAQFEIKKTYFKIPNGIDYVAFEKNALPTRKIKNRVLMVGQIEPRKNQLQLIKALNHSDFEVHIIGQATKNNEAYLEKCKQMAAPNIHFLGRVSYAQLMQEYAEAHIHALPSWFETTGLVSLEAAFMNCVLVITEKGDTCEYFGEEAIYCQPESAESILQAVELATQTAPSMILKEKIKSEYHWENVAKLTLEVYQQVLNGKS